MDIEELKKNIDREWGYRRAEELRVQDLKNRTHERWLEELPYVHHVREPSGYLFREAANLQQVLDRADLTFCFIGGIPLQHWGEVRQTKDVDVTIFCELGNERDVASLLNDYLRPRTEDLDILRVGRMYLGLTPSGKQVDVSLGYTPYERRMTDRAVEVDYGEAVPLRICSAEDLVVTKVLANRGQDWVDVRRIVQRSGMSMDWVLVYHELESLLNLANQEENLTRLKQIVAEEYPSGAS